MSARVTISTRPMSTTQAAAWRKLWAILLAPESSDATPSCPEKAIGVASTNPPAKRMIGDHEYGI
jgi:hypothetical protein